MFDGLLNFGSVIPVLLIVIVLVLVVAYMGTRYKVAGANEALIISGRREKGAEGQVGLKVVRGQGVIVLPLVNKVGRLHLSARQINIQLSDAVTKQGIKVAVQGVATVKIGSDEESIRAAAERFLEREDQIDSIVKNVLEGSLRPDHRQLHHPGDPRRGREVQSAARSDLATLRSIVGTLTVEELNYDRAKFQLGYMDLIGQQETARRERDARMAKAQADQEAAVREAEAQQVKLNAQRDVSLREAEVASLTQAAQAKAAQAGPLAQAEATQEVTRKQTELAQLEADRKQKELIASTIRPAEAEADAQVKRAEGEKLARIAAAQAEAERVRLAGQAEAAINVMKGEAQARVTLVNAESIAKQTTLEGNAEAGIVLSKGEAEAKALALRADAYRQFNEAAVIQTVLSMLPEIVRAAAEPMANIDQLTVLSNDGASEMVKNTTRTVTEASATVKGLTGIDVPALIGQSMGARFDGDGGSTRAGGGSGGSGRGSGGSGPSGGSGGGSGGSGGGSKPTSARRRAEPPAPRAMASGTEASAEDGRSIADKAAQDASATMHAAVSELDRTADRAREAVDRAIGQPVPAPVKPATAPAQAAAKPAPAAGMPAPAPSKPASSGMDAIVDPAARAAASQGVASAGLARESTLSQAAEALADDLMRIPGIQRFGAMRLEELESAGPRPLRTMWRIARDQLEREYGQLTIGEIIDRYRGSGGGGGAIAGA